MMRLDDLGKLAKCSLADPWGEQHLERLNGARSGE
jgi:hypothetical protein